MKVHDRFAFKKIKRLPKPCIRCKQRFRPTGKHSKICKECFESGIKLRIKIREAKRKAKQTSVMNNRVNWVFPITSLTKPL